MVRHCHFVVCSCWNLGYCMIDHVVMLVLEHFWSVYFLSWCNLDNVGGLWNFENVGSLWCCWMNFGLDFRSIGIVKNLCCALEWICSWYMWKSFLACVNFVLWTRQNFVGMCMDKFIGMKKFLDMKFWQWKFFFWVCDVGSWKIFVVMILAMWEFTCCAWTCRKLSVGYLGHVETFVHGYGKKIW